MSYKSNLEKEIREAYTFLRTNNQSISDDTLDFILAAALEKCKEYRTPYDKNFGDNRKCECGHPYYRHFDPYENYEAVGCKYCGCQEFKEEIHAKNQPNNSTIN